MKLRLLLLATYIAFSVLCMVAPCSADEEIEMIRSIERGGLRLEFPTESLDCQTDNTNRGIEQECKLLPPGGLFTKRAPVTFTFYEDNQQRTEILKGEVVLSKPVLLRYSDPGTHSAPFLVLKANALKGLELKLQNLSMPGPFNSQLGLQGNTRLLIKEHTEIFSTPNGSNGSFLFSARQLRLNGISVTLPGVSPSKHITMTNSGSASFAYDMTSKQADIHNGIFKSSSPLQYNEPQVFSLYGLQVPIKRQATLESFKISVSQKGVLATISGFSTDAEAASYRSNVNVTASNVVKMHIAIIESAVARLQESVVFSGESTLLKQINVSGNLKILPLAKGPVFLEGEGTITAGSLTSAGLSGDLFLKSISHYPDFGPGLLIKGSRLRVNFSQSKSKDVYSKGEGLLHEIRLGPAHLDGMSAVMKFSADGQGKTEFQVEPVRAQTRILQGPTEGSEKEVIHGETNISSLKGNVTQLMSPERKLHIGKNKFQLRFANPSLNAFLLGAPMKVDLSKEHLLTFSNDDLEASISDGVRGKLISNSLSVTTPALHSILLPGGDGIRIGNGTLSASQVFFTVDLQNASTSPFGITGTFGIKGLRHQFDSPTKVRMNDIQLTTSRIDIPEVTVAVNLVKAKVAIRNFTLVGTEFSMVSKKGKTETPAIKGILAVPMRIELAEAEIPFTSPIELFNLNIEEGNISLTDVQYTDPGKSNISVPKATLSIRRLGDEAISAIFAASDGKYEFNKDDNEFIGAGSVDLKSVKLELDSPTRKPLKGVLTLSLGSFSVKGIYAWKPLELFKEWFPEGVAANPDFTVPLNVSTVIPEASGAFRFKGDEVDGALVSHGEMPVDATFLGPPRTAKKWEKTWRLLDEVRWRTEYPCGGTWREPVRTCESWGVLVPNTDALLRWNYTIAGALVKGRLGDVHFVPKREKKTVACEADPDLCPGGSVEKELVTGIKQCRGQLMPGSFLKMFQSLSPDLINDNGEIAKLWNAAGQIVFSFIADVLLTVYSLWAQASDHLMFGKC